MKFSVVITNCTIYPCKGVPFLGYCVELVFCHVTSRIVLETASKLNAEKTAEWYANNYNCEIERYYHD